MVRLLNVFDDEEVRRYNEAIDNASDVETLLRNLELDAEVTRMPKMNAEFPERIHRPDVSRSVGTEGRARRVARVGPT